jgi:hypothetical protein
LAMRSFLVFLAITAVSAFSLADSPTVDSLPPPVADTLKAQIGEGTVRNIETFQWGDSTIYKIVIDQNGQPYLELEIADTGKLVRIDELAMSETDEEDNADVSPTPTPKGSRHR